MRQDLTYVYIYIYKSYKGPDINLSHIYKSYLCNDLIKLRLDANKLSYDQ